MAELACLAGARRSRSSIVSPEGKRAQRHLAGRRRRDAMFGSGLFGEPAWDMLLMLFVAREEGRHVTVSDLCREADAPETTTHRWLLALIADGLVLRVGDPGDRRRSYLYLSAQAVPKMRQLLNEMR